jgi:hypothetical protein
VARGRLCTPHRSQLSPPTVPWSVPPPSNYMPFHALCPYPGNDSHHAFQRALAAAGLTIAARGTVVWLAALGGWGILKSRLCPAQVGKCYHKSEPRRKDTPGPA